MPHQPVVKSSAYCGTWRLNTMGYLQLFSSSSTWNLFSTQLHLQYYLNNCFQQSAEWLPISRPVVIMASILSTWAVCRDTSLCLDCADFWLLLSGVDWLAWIKSSITQEVLASNVRTLSQRSCNPEHWMFNHV